MNASLRTFAALLLLPCAASAQSLWTVDAGGGGDFVELQAAIDFAADGDTLSIAAGTYAPIRIDGKALRLHAAGGTVTVFNNLGGTDEQAILVRNLAASQSVVFDGIAAQSFLAGASSTIRVSDCAGPVWIQRAFVDAYGTIALHVDGSDSVVVDQGLFQTNLTTPSPSGAPQPGPGALVEDGSHLYAYDSQFRGSHGPIAFGGAPPVAAAQDGGHGLVLVDSEADLSGGSAHGGGGSAFFDGACTATGDGGSGLVLSGASRLRFTGSGFFGAIGGLGDTCGAPGLAGADIVADPAALLIDTERAARTIAFSTGLLSAGDTLDALVQGEAGDLYLVFASLGAQAALALPTGFADGQLDLHVLPAPLTLVLAGALEASQDSASLVAPSLPPGVVVSQLALQGVVLGADGFLHGAAPLGLTLLP